MFYNARALAGRRVHCVDFIFLVLDDDDDCDACRCTVAPCGARLCCGTQRCASCATASLELEIVCKSERVDLARPQLGPPIATLCDHDA